MIFFRMGGEQSEMNFCENKSLSMPTLRMTCEAKVKEFDLKYSQLLISQI